MSRGELSVAEAQELVLTDLAGRIKTGLPEIWEKLGDQGLNEQQKFLERMYRGLGGDIERQKSLADIGATIAGTEATLAGAVATRAGAALTAQETRAKQYANDLVEASLDDDATTAQILGAMRLDEAQRAEMLAKIVRRRIDAAGLEALLTPEELKVVEDDAISRLTGFSEGAAQANQVLGNTVQFFTGFQKATGASRTARNATTKAKTRGDITSLYDATRTPGTGQAGLFSGSPRAFTTWNDAWNVLPEAYSTGQDWVAESDAAGRFSEATFYRQINDSQFHQLLNKIEIGIPGEDATTRARQGTDLIIPNEIADAAGLGNAISGDGEPLVVPGTDGESYNLPGYARVNVEDFQSAMRLQAGQRDMMMNAAAELTDAVSQGAANTEMLQNFVFSAMENMLQIPGVSRTAYGRALNAMVGAAKGAREATSIPGVSVTTEGAVGELPPGIVPEASYTPEEEAAAAARKTELAEGWVLETSATQVLDGMTHAGDAFGQKVQNAWGGESTVVDATATEFVVKDIRTGESYNILKSGAKLYGSVLEALPGGEFFANIAAGVGTGLFNKRKVAQIHAENNVLAIRGAVNYQEAISDVLYMEPSSVEDAQQILLDILWTMRNKPEVGVGLLMGSSDQYKNEIGRWRMYQQTLEGQALAAGKVPPPTAERPIAPKILNALNNRAAFGIAMKVKQIFAPGSPEGILLDRVLRLSPEQRYEDSVRQEERESSTDQVDLSDVGPTRAPGKVMPSTGGIYSPGEYREVSGKLPPGPATKGARRSLVNVSIAALEAKNAWVDMQDTEAIHQRNQNPAALRYVPRTGMKKGEGGFAKFATPMGGLFEFLKTVEGGVQRNDNLGQFILSVLPPGARQKDVYINEVAAEVNRRSGKQDIGPFTLIWEIDPILLSQVMLLSQTGSKLQFGTER